MTEQADEYALPNDNFRYRIYQDRHDVNHEILVDLTNMPNRIITWWRLRNNRELLFSGLVQSVRLRQTSTITTIGNSTMIAPKISTIEPESTPSM